jgi:hypothetical protein
MNTDHNNTPEDLRATAESLDRLAAHAADAAPPGLEDRLFLRTAASLGGAAPEAVRPEHAHAPQPIPIWNHTAFRLAAAIALVAAVSIFFTLPNFSSTADLADDSDAYLEQLDSILAVAYEPDPIAELDTLDSDLAELLATDTFDELNTWLETEEAL